MLSSKNTSTSSIFADLKFSSLLEIIPLYRSWTFHTTDEPMIKPVLLINFVHLRGLALLLPSTSALLSCITIGILNGIFQVIFIFAQILDRWEKKAFIRDRLCYPYIWHAFRCQRTQGYNVVVWTSIGGTNYCRDFTRSILGSVFPSRSIELFFLTSHGCHLDSGAIYI